MKRIYLDHAATTPTDSEVLETMKPYFSEKFGNPSALYSYGRETKQALEVARDQVARAIGASNEEIVFTSGGTESDNFALQGAAFANQKKGNHIITSSIEHHAILETCKFLEKRGFQTTYLPVNADGLVDPADVDKAITEATVLISIMHSNNEIGTIQPIAEIGKVAKEKGIYLHTDAVQSIAALPINVDELNVDLLSMSAHKFYGPKGVGVIYVRSGTRMISYLHGGGQERRRRASTENIPGIVGLGKAIEIAQDRMDENVRIKSLRDKLIDGINARIDDVRLNGHPKKRLSNNVSLCIEKIEGESVLLNLDAKGICASTGSACSSAALEPSHVLLAMGVDPVISHGSLRFTLGRKTTEQDIDYLLEVLPEIVKKLRDMSPLYNTKENSGQVADRPS